MFRSNNPTVEPRPWLDVQRRQKSHSSGLAKTSPGNTTYDTESGQVYMERTIRAPSKAKLDWINEYKTPALIKRRHANREGVASLFDMAKAKTVREMRNLTPKHFEGIPPPIGRKLWEEVEDSRLESFHAWRIFASAFPDSFQSPFRRYFLDIKQPVLPLDDYFRGLDGESIDWLTCLRIAPARIDRSDLVRVAQLRNIVVLDLSDDNPIDRIGTQIDERIFKTWMEMIKDGNTFKHVRVILMRGQDDVSTWIFKYLDSFPSLCFIIFSDCRLLHQKSRSVWTDEAATFGWEARHAKKSAKSLRHLIDDKNFYLGAVSGCYYHTEEVFDELATKRKSKLPARLPVVEAWIGRPKPWLHLIDEFPGARTVWFDNTKTKEAARKAEARRETEAPVLARAARAARTALPERIKSPTEENTKRTRDMLSSPGSEPKSPPYERVTMKLRSRTKNLDQIMADFG